MKKLLFFLSVFCFGFSNVNIRPVHIFMIGDSTMANKSQKAIPETGWGQVLQDFFIDSVVVENHAKNGRSSKSFREEGLWDSVISKVQEGDYVIIQFGHNDKKSDEKRHTDPFTTFSYNLQQYIDETREKGGIPIICTSIVRRHFTENGKLKDTHGDYIAAAKKVAEQSGVDLIDMEAMTRKVIEELGPEKSKSLFMFLPPHIYPDRYNGCADSTHLTQLGAYTVASLAVEGMKEKNIKLVKFLKNN